MLLVTTLSSCWVNQNFIASADKVDLGAGVASGSQTLDVAYGTDPAQRLDVFRPVGRQVGTILYFHSGGFIGGSKTNVPALVFQQLNRGWAVVSVEYRFAGSDGVRAPEVLADVDRSIRFVKANAGPLDLEVSTVVASGWSAGGLLALMAGVAPGFQVDPTLPPALAGVSPVVDGVITLAGSVGSGVLGPGQLHLPDVGAGLPRLPGTTRAAADHHHVDHQHLHHEHLHTSTSTSTTSTTEPPTTSSSTSSTASTSTSTTEPPTTSTSAEEPTAGTSIATAPPCTALPADPYSPAYRAAFAAWTGVRLPPAYIAIASDDPIMPIESQGFPLAARWAAAAGAMATYFDVPPAGGHNSPVQVNKTVFDWWLSKVAARSF